MSSVNKSQNHPFDLSICMIVKNEAALLARCLKSIDGCAAEIVVVDTGSSDDTIAIAESCGARVIRSDWRDDFSYSRNLSIAQAKGKWILWLDADDVVPKLSIPLIQKLAQEKPDKVFGFIVKNEKPGNTGSEFMQARMFPNRKDVYFERRIHEQVMLSALRAGLQLVETTVVVEHHGYVETGKIREKAERNVRLLLAEWESESPDVVRAIEIADSFFNLANFPDAQKWYETVLAIPQCEKQFPDIASQAYLGLGNIQNKNWKFTDAIECFAKALALCPNRPDVKFSLAVAQDLSGNLAEAAETLRSVLVAPPDTLKVSIDFREAKIKAYLRLERILFDLGKKDDLLTIAREAEKLLVHRPEILAMAGRIYFVNKLYAEALHAFEKSLELNIDQNCDSYIGLCNIYCLAGKSGHAISTMENIRELFCARPAFWAYWIKLFGEPSTKDIPADVDMKELEKERRNLEKIYGR